MKVHAFDVCRPFIVLLFFVAFWQGWRDSEPRKGEEEEALKYLDPQHSAFLLPLKGSGPSINMSAQQLGGLVYIDLRNHIRDKWKSFSNGHASFGGDCNIL